MKQIHILVTCEVSICTVKLYHETSWESWVTLVSPVLLIAFWFWRDLQPVTCNLQPVTCELQPVTCDLQPATCDLQKKSTGVYLH